MTSLISSLFIALVVVASTSLVTSRQSSPRIIDKRDNPLSNLAQVLCDDVKDVQFGRLSTITDLVSYFNNWKHVKCNPQYLKILNDLNDLISVREDVCAPWKISLLQNFHEKYIANEASDAVQRPMQTPSLLASFFINYALDVSDTCKKSINPNLHDNRIENFKEKYYNLGIENMPARFAKRMNDVFGGRVSMETYEDVILLWDEVQEAMMESGETDLQRYIEDVHPVGSEVLTKAYVSMSNPQVLIDMQHRCRQLFKPVYDEVIKPVVQLSKLGYSANDFWIEQKLKEARSDSLVNKWYRVMQICEAVLPIKPFLDESMQEYSMKLLTKEEAQEMKQSEIKPSINLKSATYVAPIQRNKIYSDDLLSINSEESMRLIDNFKFGDKQAKGSWRNALRKAAKLLPKN